MSTLTESALEGTALTWLDLGYAILHDTVSALGETFAERETYGQAVLERRLYPKEAERFPAEVI